MSSWFNMDRSIIQRICDSLTPAEDWFYPGHSHHLRISLPILLFAVTGILLVGTISWIHIFSPFNLISYERDIWHHLAVLNELIASPLQAMNPHVLTDDPSRSYTPWTVLLAVIANLFRLDAQQALGVSALLTMLCFVSGVWLFARTYWNSPWAPFILLIVLISTWGFHINHTGYYTLSTLTTSASFQFGIVLALGFWSWWLVLDAIRAGRLTPGLAVGLAVVAWLMFIIHQLQGAFAIGAMLTFAAFAGEARVGRRLLIIGTIITGVILSKTWWYFDPIDYILLDEVPKGPKDPYRRDLIWMLNMAGMALIGIWGIYDRKRKRLRLDLLVGTLAITIGFAVLWYLEIWVFFRVLPFWILFLQLGMTCLVVDSLPTLSDLNRTKFSASKIFPLCIIAMLVSGLSSNIYNAINFRGRVNDHLNGVEATYPDAWTPHSKELMAKIRREFQPNSVLIAQGKAAFLVEASHMKVVAIPRLFALVPDMLERQQANKEFFAESTSNVRRCEIINLYGAAGILFRHRWLPAAVQEQLKDYGKLIIKYDLSLIKLRGYDENISKCNS